MLIQIDAAHFKQPLIVRVENVPDGLPGFRVEPEDLLAGVLVEFTFLLNRFKWWSWQTQEISTQILFDCKPELIQQFIHIPRGQQSAVSGPVLRAELRPGAKRNETQIPCQ